MAQYDLVLTQNVAAAGIDFTERTVALAKGTLISANASSVPTALVGGTNGYVLSRDDAEVTGLKWIAAPTNYWQRNTTVISPATAGDTLSIDSITVPITTGKYAFGDGDSYFYESADDQIMVYLAAAARWRFTTGQFRMDSNGGPSLQAENSSATNPVFCTINSDANTGLGGAASQVSAIISSVEKLRVTATGINVDVIDELVTNAGVAIDGILHKDYVIDAQDGSLKHLSVYAGDASGAAGTDAGDLIFKAGNALNADSGSVNGVVKIVPGNHYSGASGGGTVYLGDDSLFTGNTITVSFKSSATNGSIYIQQKGTGALGLGLSTGPVYISGTIVQSTPDINMYNMTASIYGMGGQTSAGGTLTIRGGTASGGTFNGGNLYLYGGAGSGGGTAGLVYVGTGSAGTYPLATATTSYVLFYNTTTGQVTYGSAPGGTTPVDSTLLDWSTDRYQPYASRQAGGEFYSGSAADPNQTTRLNYNGYFYSYGMFAGAAGLATTSPTGNTASVTFTSGSSFGSIGIIDTAPAATTIQNNGGHIRISGSNYVAIGIHWDTNQFLFVKAPISGRPVATFNSYDNGAIAKMTDTAFEGYYSNAKKFETTSGGATITGTVVVTAIASTATTNILCYNTGTGAITYNASGGGTTNFLRADGTWAAPGGGGVTYVGGTDVNNRVITATGSGTINGEANLTFDGTTLTVAGTGGVSCTGGNISIGSNYGLTFVKDNHHSIQMDTQDGANNGYNLTIKGAAAATNYDGGKVYVEGGVGTGTGDGGAVHIVGGNGGATAGGVSGAVYIYPGVSGNAIGNVSICHNGTTAYGYVGIRTAPSSSYGLKVSGEIYSDDDMRATNFILTSDGRLKTNVQVFIPERMDIDYKKFEYKSKLGVVRYGVIAQEVQEKYPELVQETDGELGVRYTDLLIREIAYLKDKVKELEGRLN